MGQFLRNGFWKRRYPPDTQHQTKESQDQRLGKHGVHQDKAQAQLILDGRVEGGLLSLLFCSFCTELPCLCLVNRSNRHNADLPHQGNYLRTPFVPSHHAIHITHSGKSNLLPEAGAWVRPSPHSSLVGDVPASETESQDAGRSDRPGFFCQFLEQPA